MALENERTLPAAVRCQTLVFTAGDPSHGLLLLAWLECPVRGNFSLHSVPSPRLSPSEPPLRRPIT